MYPEYEKINAYLAEASLLYKTTMRMEDIFYFTMKKNEKKIAAEFQNEKGKLKHYKYSKFRSNTYAFASIINNLLLQEAKSVPIILKLANGPHWGEIFWAILMAGYKPLLVDAKTSKDGIMNLAKQAKAIAIVTDDSHKYEEILKITLDDLLNETHHYNFAPHWENEVIFCSSGTTGDVKMMVYNGENLVHQICCSLDMPKETKDIMYPKKYGRIKILAMIPFHHIFGFVAVFLWFTFYGTTLVYPSSNSPLDIQGICQKAEVTHVFSVPLFWDSLALQLNRKLAIAGQEKQELVDNLIGYNTERITKKEAEFASRRIVQGHIQKQLLGKYVKFCISGGGYLSQETLTTINGIGYNLYNGYGMTEIGVTSVELSADVQDRLKGRIGKPLHGVEYKIAGNDKKGELLVKSPTLHIKEIIGGVIKNTELDENGYFHTGDIAEIDATNAYSIKGRIKDIIINSDGENIFPDELEIFFKNIPHVTHLCVLGISKKKSTNENIVLVLELDNQADDQTIKGIQNQIKEIVPTLPHSVKINNVYLSKRKLPLANNMKVKRYLIKKALETKSPDFVLIDAKHETKIFEGFDKETIENIVVPVRNIFSKVLILPAFKIDDDSHWINDLGGDSMNYIELIKELQDEFHIEFNEEELLAQELTCVNDFVLEIAKKQKETNK